MLPNEIHGSICVKSTNDKLGSVDKTVKILRHNEFITEFNPKKIIFKRHIQFTEDTGRNKLKVFLFSYSGTINIREDQENIFYEYTLNINAQIFKLALLMILIYLFFYIYSTNVHLLSFILIFVLIIFIQRALIKNHFTNIIN
jgi:hypothetical protein